MHLTPQNIADDLKVKKTTVLNWIAIGDLPAVKLGRGYRISENDYKRFLHARLTVKPW